MDNNTQDVRPPQSKTNTEIPILNEKVSQAAKPKASGWLKFFVLISLSCSLAALGGVGFFWFEQQQKLDSTVSPLVSIEQKVSSFERASAAKRSQSQSERADEPARDPASQTAKQPSSQPASQPHSHFVVPSHG